MDQPETTSRNGFSDRGFSQPADKLFLAGDVELTYGELNDRIGRLSALFRNRKINPGEVLLLAVHSPDYFAQILLACVTHGIGVNICSPDCSAREARRLIENTNPDHIVLDQALYEAWNDESESIDRRLLFTVKKAAGGGLLGRMLGNRKSTSTAADNTYPALLDNLEPEPLHESVDPKLPAYIINTSGTTSDPKSVLISRRATLFMLHCLSGKYRVSEDSRILNVLPYTLGDGLGHGPLLAWYNGCTWVRPIEFNQGNLPRILDGIYTYRTTHFITVPVMMSLILGLEEEYHAILRDSALEVVLSTAAALPSDLWKQFEQACGVEVCNQYGMTECPVGIYCGPDPESRKPGTIGKPYGCEIRLVDDKGKDVEGEGQGTLWMRSDSLMDGYLNNPRATDDILVDGWINTGDIARRDSEGFILIVGRNKSMISFAGHNINPAEIVEVLESAAGVREAAVVGIERQPWGEIPVAFAVPEVESTLDRQALFDHCRENLVEYRVPREIRLLEKLPRSPNGKVQEAALVDAYHSQAPEPSGGTTERIQAIARRCFRNERELLPEDNAATVQGWDSLAHMDLILSIEKQFDIRFSAREIMTIESFGGLVDLVNEKLVD